MTAVSDPADAYSTMLDDLLRPPRWFGDALCREYRHLDWMADKGPAAAETRAVCHRCAVVAECQAWGLTLDASTSGQHGMLGAMTRPERRAIQLGARQAA
jgi:hypothetical protein